MSNTAKLLTGIIVVVLIVLGVVGLGGSDNNSSDPVKIGVIAPLSGDRAFMGEGMKNAIELAKQDIGDKDLSHDYEIIYADSQLDNTKSASAANKLISTNNVDSLISFSSGVGSVVSPIAKKNGVIHFGIGSAQNIAKGDRNFIHWTPPSAEAKVLVDELQERDISRVGVFELQQEGATAQIDAFAEAIEGTDIEIVAREKFPFGERDFRSIIRNVVDDDPQILLMIAFSPELEVLTQQIRDLGVEIPLTGMETFELTDQQELFEGEWYVHAANPSDNFRDKYQKLTGGDNPPVGAANTFDIYKLLVNSFEGASSTGKPSLRGVTQQLHSIDGFDGALGELQIDERGVVISDPTVKKIKNGEPVVTE